MKEEDLQKILNGEELLYKVDVKTLILDLINKHTSNEDLIQMFMDRLPDLDESYVKRFLYMIRK